MMTILLFGCLLLSSFEAMARSAHSPRHSGMEPPGGPRPLEGLPGKSPSRTDDGGMGYQDAYGRTIDNHPVEDEKKERKRLHPGAFGSYGRQKQQNVMPMQESEGPPIWRFQNK